MNAGCVKRWILRVAAGLAISTLLLFVVFAALSWAFPFPLEQLERWPASPVVTDCNGRPLLSLVGSDDQWRYPIPLAQISPWIVQATLAVEDKRFFSHSGVDLIAVGRAVIQNMTHGRIVSGASTLTMQTCRMLGNRPRTWAAKTVESFQALQLEQLTTKGQLLEQYLNIAPYGGNIRGVEAASRFYFGKRCADLSLSEAALLAGLPQSPSQLRPDRHKSEAIRRRETVLHRMSTLGMINARQAELATSEPVAIRKIPRTSAAPHAARLALRRRPQGGKTTIDLRIQREVERVLSEHTSKFPRGADAAVVVIEIATSNIIAMVGSADFEDPADGQVNGCLALRSPGSTLKPFVYAAAFDAGLLCPDSIVYDMPIHRAGWSPENFDRQFCGETTVRDALQRSLNVPAILVSEAVGLTRCVGLINAAGVALPNSAERHGGLALVVGSVEVRLLDLVNGYATLGRGGVHTHPRLFVDDKVEASIVLGGNVCSAINAILSSHNHRPRTMEHLAPDDVPWFMWKTGTSSGRRDAWAVGHNAVGHDNGYAIGVWVGRFSGAGSIEFAGAKVAEPILASMFSTPLLCNDKSPTPYTPWTPSLEMKPPAGAGGPLRILAPKNGTLFHTIAGAASVQVRANHNERLTWFLNGRLTTEPEGGLLRVGRGTYVLYCVDSSGASSEVRFSAR